MDAPSRKSLSSACLWLAALAPLPAAFAQAPSVRVVEPELRQFERLSNQPGTAEPFYEADLGAKVSGYVSELLVDIGSRVETGQVLARIAVPELAASRKALAANVDALTSERDRAATLVDRGSLTQRTLDEAENRLESAEARLREVDEQLRYATIEAPFDGIVTWRAIDPGDMVFEAGSPKGSDQALLKVARTDIIRVKTYLPEYDAVWADVGDPATVSFDALPGQSFTSTLARAAGSLDPSTRTMQVEIDLPNPDGRILPGLYGRTAITLESRDRVLALPASAVRFTEDGNAYVYVISADDTAHRRAVTVGLDDGNWIEISSDLTEGETVADGLVGSLDEGEKVTIVRNGS